MRSTLFILWLLSAIPVFAQSDSLHIYSMQGVYQQNNWLTGANPVECHSTVSARSLWRKWGIGLKMETLVMSVCRFIQ
jgi:hypothetical protein